MNSLLVSSDFSEGYGSGPVSVGLLDTSSGLGSGLPGGLGGDWNKEGVCVRRGR